MIGGGDFFLEETVSGDVKHVSFNRTHFILSRTVGGVLSRTISAGSGGQNYSSNVHKISCMR